MVTKKNQVRISLVLFVCLFSMAFNALASPPQNGKARDLFIQSGRNNNPSAPGTEVSIELERNGRTTRVNPADAVFFSGDRIRLHFAVNYDGYLAVMNVGSSGRSSLLFPYGNLDGRVKPTEDYQVPPGNDWIRFDNIPGQEKLTVVLSNNPIRDVNEYLNANKGSSGGSLASSPEADRILQSLNTRAISRTRGLLVESNTSSSVVVCPPGQQQMLDEPTAFVVTLDHK